MTSITSFGLREYKRKYSSDIVNIVIDIGLLTPSKIRVNKKMQFYDEDTKLWVYRQKIDETLMLYRVYKALSKDKDYPDEDKSALLFEVRVTPDDFKIGELIRGEWEKQLSDLVAKRKK